MLFSHDHCTNRQNCVVLSVVLVLKPLACSVLIESDSTLSARDPGSALCDILQQTLSDCYFLQHIAFHKG